MTATEALTKLKVMLGLNTEVVETVTETVIEASEEEVTETIETKFAEATLIDGTVVKTEGDIEVGKPLFVVTEDGDIAAPEGMHQTTDNLLITVDAEGIIVSVEEVTEEPVAEETPATEETPVEAESFNAEELVSSIADLMRPALEEINSLKEELATLQTNFSVFKDEPAGKKVSNNLQEFNATAKSTEEARFEALKRIRNTK